MDKNEMNLHIKISIIIPVFNCEKFLEKCLKSVINQTYQNLEIIIINDGSKDFSAKICDDFALKDSRIVVIHKENAGVVSAALDGINIATGEKVIFVDSDDYIKDDFVENLVNISEENDIVICDFIIVNELGDEVSKGVASNLPEGLYSMHFLRNLPLLFVNSIRERPISHTRWGKLIKIDIAKKSLNDCNKNIKIGEDWQFIIICLLRCEKLFVLHDEGYIYRENFQSVMLNYSKNLVEMYMLLVDELEKQLINSNWNNLEMQLKHARINCLLNSVMNESRNKNRKSRKNELKKIIENYIKYKLKNVNYVENSHNKRLILSAIRKKNIFMLILICRLKSLQDYLRKRKLRKAKKSRCEKIL